MSTDRPEWSLSASKHRCEQDFPHPPPQLALSRPSTAILWRQLRSTQRAYPRGEGAAWRKGQLEGSGSSE